MSRGFDIEHDTVGGAGQLEIVVVASWLNQVERWFARITQRAIRRGSFRSVKDLIEKIAAIALANSLPVYTDG